MGIYVWVFCVEDVELWSVGWDSSPEGPAAANWIPFFVLDFKVGAKIPGDSEQELGVQCLAFSHGFKCSLKQ